MIVVKVNSVHDAERFLRELNDDPDLEVNQNKIYQSIATKKGYLGGRFSYEVPRGCKDLLFFQNSDSDYNNLLLKYENLLLDLRKKKPRIKTNGDCNVPQLVLF